MFYLGKKKDFKVLKKHLLKFYTGNNLDIEKSDNGYYEVKIVEDIGDDITVKFENMELVKKLIESKSKFIFASYKPLKKYKHKLMVDNLNNKPDRRYKFLKNGKPKYFYPPEGFDGYVYVNRKAKYREKISRKKVSIGAIIFHELYECYFIVDKNIEYMAGAHDMAVNKEYLLLHKLSKFNYSNFTVGSTGKILVKRYYV